MKCRVALLLLLTPALTAPAFAGIFFNNKKPDKPSPSDRVPELLKIVQSDGDEDKRVSAAEELRDYDPAQFPMVAPVLIEVLVNDKKPAVRAEAALSLGKLRPVSDQVGLALEQSLAKDPSMRVRLQDRSVLLQYRWSGWKGPAAPAAPAPKKDEVPTARPKTPPTVQSGEPPLAPPAPTVAPTPPMVAPPPTHETRSLPQGPPLAPPAAGDGPVLNPPG